MEYNIPAHFKTHFILEFCNARNVCILHFKYFKFVTPISRNDPFRELKLKP